MEVGRLKAFIGKSRLGCPSAQRFASDWGFENVMNGGECVGGVEGRPTYALCQLIHSYQSAKLSNNFK